MCLEKYFEKILLFLFLFLFLLRSKIVSAGGSVKAGYKTHQKVFLEYILAASSTTRQCSLPI